MGQLLDNTNMVKEDDRCDCRSASFEELLSFGKEKAKGENKGIGFNTSMRSFGCTFCDGNTMDDEIVAVAMLKLARGTILEFRVD